MRRQTSPLRFVARYVPSPYLEVGAMLILAIAAAYYN